MSEEDEARKAGRQVVAEELNEHGVVRPALGRIVWYRSRTGDYTVPATVAATKDSLHQENVDAGLIPDLTDELHVHLVCFSAGKQGMREEAVDFEVESPHGRMENQGGSYQEFDIAFDPNGSPGTWRWPDRV